MTNQKISHQKYLWEILLPITVFNPFAGAISLRRCLLDLHGFLEELSVGQSFFSTDVGHGFGPAFLRL